MWARELPASLLSVVWKNCLVSLQPPPLPSRRPKHPAKLAILFLATSSLRPRYLCSRLHVGARLFALLVLIVPRHTTPTTPPTPSTNTHQSSTLRCTSLSHHFSLTLPVGPAIMGQTLSEPVIEKVCPRCAPPPHLASAHSRAQQWPPADARTRANIPPSPR
jgi:hypothetical protein